MNRRGFRRLGFAVCGGALLLLALLRWRETPAPAASRSLPPAAPAAAPSRAAVAPSPRALPRSPEEMSPVLAAASSPLGRFQDWARRYLAASPAARAALVTEGLQLAAERRPLFKQLIRDNPREALRQAVPVVVRQELPAEVLALLEERVGGRAQLRVYQSYPLGEGAPPSPTLRYAEFEGGSTYQAYVYGRRTESVRWLPNASVNGVAIDRQLAVNESPLRQLELGEKPPAGKPAIEVCPVSGKTTPADPTIAVITEETPAVEVHGQVVYLCDGSHLTIYEGIIIQAEGGTGGPQRFTGLLPASPSPSLGELRVLYVITSFADQSQVPESEARAREVMRDVADFFSKASYGRLTCTTTVTPPVKLPHNVAWYVQKDNSDGVSKEIDGLGLEQAHAREEARKLGYDPADYDNVIVRIIGGANSVGVGGWGGGSGVVLYSSSASVAAHEIGHCFGLSHANFWDTGGASAIGPGGNNEYGDIFDVMGAGQGAIMGHYNAQAKSQIRWMTAELVQTVTASGTYRINAFDQLTIDPSKRYALKIAKDSQRTYWGEVRTQYDATNKWAANGLVLGWQWPINLGSNIQLIDTTPASPGGKNDSPIVLGQTFSDFEAGLHFTTVAVNTDAGERTIDVVVNLGQFPGNRAPTLTLAASALNVPTGAPVTFTATAADPDGDPLAYQWLSSDNTSLNSASAVIGPNAPAFTRSFATSGQYVVTCIASDMKGGRALRQVLVNVGSATTRYSISGRVKLGAQGLAGVYMSTGTGNGVLSDSDGYYAIPNLTAGTYTVVPQLFGYTFADLFDNDVLVGPNFAGADFAADPTPTVALTAAVSTTAEGGTTPGRFTLTRTGPDGEALSVRIVPPAGTATITSDYTLSPAPTAGSPYQTLTIPAGQSTLDVLVTPVNDTAAEGPETVILELGVDAGYVIAGNARATVTIEDNDTTLPKVALSADTVDATERGPRPANFTVTRTGATSAALTVNLTFGGTATNGGDYVALGPTATIPAGAGSVNVTVLPIDDSISEGFETVTATIASAATYIVEASAATATIRISDDDLQVVSLEVADASAAEVDLTAPGAVPNPGVFVISRTGDTAQPLTVFYSLAGTALHGVDYEPLAGSVTISAGQTRAAVVITPRFDRLGEAAETVILQLSISGAGNYRLGEISTGTVTIDDAGDAPVAEVIPIANAREPATAGKFRFTLQGGGTGPVTVKYAVSGTATAGVDYEALSGTVTIPGGGANNFVDVTVTPIDDTIAEELETITVTITADPAYQTWAPTRSATILLYDDEQPTVFVDAQTTASNGLATLAENSATPGKFYLSRTGATTAPLTVNYTISGTATNGVDYQALAGTAVIPADKPGVDVLVTPIQDTIAEGTETIILTLAPGAYGRGPAATIYLTDDETPAVAVGFSTAGTVVTEAAGTVNIPVTLSAAATVPVTVEYATISPGLGTSSSVVATTTTPYWIRLSRTGVDFRGFRSADGVSWTQMTPVQTMPLASSIWVGLAVCSRSDGTLATATFDNVSLAPDAGGSLAGADIGFVATAGSMSLGNGIYTLNGSGAAIGNDRDGFYYAAKQVTGDFTFTARVLSSTGGASTRYAGVMAREDLGRSSRHAFAGQTGTSQTIWFARTGIASNALGSGVDYQLATGTLTFAPGTTVQNIPIALVDDAVVEPNEYIVLSLRNANGATLGALAQHVVTITDNDSSPLQPSLGFAAASSRTLESAAPAVLVALSRPAATPVTVNYAVTGGTATSGQDFNLPAGALTFAPGETIKAVPIDLIDDPLLEGSETVQITLSNPSGAALTTQSAHILTILDNDTPVISVAATNPTASEGGAAGQWTFTRTGSLAAPVTVNFTVAGTATGGTEYAPLGTSITIPAGSASATLALTALADGAVENDETVILTLASATGYTLGPSTTATITIVDGDTATVTVAATDSSASETGSDTGTFTITRTGPVANALTVGFTFTGSAAIGSDYTISPGIAVIPAGQASATVTIRPVNDAISEGTEYVVMSLNPGAGYRIGAAGFATVTIADNDTPPTVTVASPASKSVQIAAGMGLNLVATATDDGGPNPLTYTWSKFSGPGTVSFGTPDATSTSVTFSASGLYVVRISVTDGQYTVTDDVTVQVGGFAPAEWIDMSLGSPATRGASSQIGGIFTLTGSGTGFTGTTDSAHFMGRQVAGISSIVARVTGFAAGASANALAGVMIRETGFRGARRAFVGVKPGGKVEWHTRGTANGANTVADGGTVSLPAWFKLERSGDTLTASRAPDVSGAPGPWTAVGPPLTLTTLGASVDLGLAASNALFNTTVDATFDNVTLTPAQSGPALIVEDLGTPATAGTSSQSGSAYSFTGSGNIDRDGGHYRFQQFSGDVVVTARLVSRTGSGIFPPAKGAVMIRDVSLDAAPFGAMGIGNYWGGYFMWRNVVAATGGVNYSGSITVPQWIRVIRSGDTITAWKAVNTTANTPGPWVQQGATQVFSAGAPIYVGLAADTGAGVIPNLVQFDNYSVVPGNLAPVVSAGTGGSFGNTNTVPLRGSVTDDGAPNPPAAVTRQWSVASGPGLVTFASPAAVETAATFSTSGSYVLRLTANDGEVSVFSDVAVTVNLTGGAPGITTQPANVVAVAGTTATLSIAAIGAGPITYEWRRNGVAVPGGTTATLTLANVQSAQAGTYSVAVTNPAGVAISQNATVTVNVAPSIVSAPAAGTVAVGDTVSFSVSAAGTRPMSYQWRFNGSAIAGATGETFVVNSARTLDAGVYTVVVSNVAGATTSAGATLAVDAPASFVTQPVTQTLGLGASVTFSAAAGDSGTVNYQWRRNGVAIPGATSASLTVTGVQAADAGFYDVVASKGVASAVSASARLIVQPAAFPGSVDPTARFAPRFELAGALIYACVPASNGKVFIGGDFSSVSGVVCRGVARLNPDGSLDPSFEPVVVQGGIVRALALQADGRLVIGGDFTYVGGAGRNYVARLNADGTLDAAFNNGAGFNSSVYALALQADGRVLVGGFFTSYAAVSRNRIARLEPTGALDTTFAPGTGFNNGVRALAVQADGSVVAGGDFTTANGTSVGRIARLTSRGAFDFGFNAGTGFDNSVMALLAQRDGRLVAGGSFVTFNGTARVRLARLGADGALDSAFNSGTGFSSTVQALVAQPDGKIIVGGLFTAYAGTNRLFTARLTGDGALDPTLANSSLNSAVQALGLQDDGKVIAGGLFSAISTTARPGLARFGSDGTLDATFSPGLRRAGTVYALERSTGGNWIAGGSFDFVDDIAAKNIVRFTTDGAMDTTFAIGTGFNSTVQALVLQPDGRILAGGTFTSFNGAARNRIARLAADGSLDPSFNPGTGANNTVQAILSLPDGRILVGGSFTTFGGSARNYLARLGADGTLDAAFNSGAGFNNTVSALALQPDGKIVVGGSFTSFNGTGRNRLVRFEADGSLESAFNSGTGFNNTVAVLAVQPDGRIVAGGAFTTFAGVARLSVARLTTGGALDATFGGTTGLNSSVVSLCLQADGKVVVGGSFSSFSTTPRSYLARLNASGTLDTSMAIPTLPARGSATVVRALAYAPDGTLFAGGALMDFNGFAGRALAALVAVPDFTLQPADQVFAPGASATFTVAAAGAPTPSYQWQRSTDGGTSWSNLVDAAGISGVTTPTLALTAPTPAMSGQRFRVVASNGEGSATSSAATLSQALGMSRIVNLSILTAITAADPSFTVGMVVGGAGTGSPSKPLLVRAAGPSLTPLGVVGALADPRLDLNSGSTVVASNDNWSGSTALSDAFSRVGAFAFAGGTSKDAAVVYNANAAVPPSSYTVKVSGVGGATGMVIAELYDATPSNAFAAATPRLINVSVLKQIGGGENLTVGFVIDGPSSKQVLVRAIGPTLALPPFNVGGAMDDPKLELFSGQTVVNANDNWGGDASLVAAGSSVGAFELANRTTKDAVLLATLAPGSYTVQVSGVGGTGGLTLIEVYEIP